VELVSQEANEKYRAVFSGRVAPWPASNSSTININRRS
jgi:hypothetical protein